MAIIKKKTKKKLARQLKKLVNTHGSQVALGAVTGILADRVTNEIGDSDQNEEEDRRNQRAHMAGQDTREIVRDELLSLIEQARSYQVSRNDGNSQEIATDDTLKLLRDAVIERAGCGDRKLVRKEKDNDE